MSTKGIVWTEDTASINMLATDSGRRHRSAARGAGAQCKEGRSGAVQVGPGAVRADPGVPSFGGTGRGSGAIQVGADDQKYSAGSLLKSERDELSAGVSMTSSVTGVGCGESSLSAFSWLLCSCHVLKSTECLGM